MLSEIRQIVENVAREKGIDLEIVYGALEEAYQKAGRSKYGYDYDIRATIDRKTGAVTLKRYREVREPDLIDNEAAQMTLAAAKREKKDAVVGEFLIDELPSFDYGRISAQTAKQVIVQKIRDAEREKQFEEFKDRVGEIISGVVKRVEYGNVTVDLGRAEAVLRRDECIPRENIKPGDRVRAYIYDVRREGRGPQIFISRTHPGFMAALFTQEVPEIYEGLIEIKSVARDPGSRAKIAVYAREGSIDPVGACVGMRGSRVQAVVGELQGEKIDIVPWSTDFATFVVNALAPADVSKVVFDEDKKKLDVVVPDDQLSLAIGRRGQNVRLASILIGWDIDILTEEEESKRRAEEFRTKSALFIEALDVDEVIAQLLVAEGFKTVEEIVQEDVSELIRIEGFNEEVAAELQNRAQNWLTAKAERFEKLKKELGIQEDLLSTEGLTQDQVITLAEKGVKSRDDLADLATDELVEFLGAEQMSMSAAEKIIMAARAHWFAEEDQQADGSTQAA